jgi:hypothetical protein
VVVGSSGRQPTGLLEDTPELVQDAVQEGSTRRGEGRPHGWLGVCRCAHAHPHDAVITVGEGDAVARKVLEDGAKRMEEVVAEDEVERAQCDAKTADGEPLGVDREWHVVGDTLAGDPVAIGHKHPQRWPGTRGELELSSQVRIDEVGHRAGVEEGDQLVALDGDVEDHSVLGAYPGEHVEGHLGCAGRGSLRIRVRRRDRWWLEHRGRHDLSRLPVLHVVVIEEVEEALAHVPPDVGLITVEAEALASALLLLGQG